LFPSDTPGNKSVGIDLKRSLTVCPEVDNDNMKRKEISIVFILI